ncbi:MAG: Gfo/Idh/MocA family oxidoreductase [Candidatus Hatepunaea meridiana]|nr:Gfo/Idh/MocA family oxidoreductase [Candidatus Hatepunaea meridiana]
MKENNKSEKPVSILMVAIGGYGYYYLKTLFEEIPSEKVRLCGIVDLLPERSGFYSEIIRRRIPIFSRIEDFYKNGYSADLVVISSPIHFHIPQCITALKNGSNVLCEKPVGATVQDVDELIRIRDESGKWVMIGYQWSYSRAIQSLKRDIMKGLFGKPLRLKTLCLWSRNDAYYQRNDWAGKIKDAEGRLILDSPANNAMAHYVHNMFYILGEETHLSTQPDKVTAELYRANPIENYDTIACRIHTDKGTELLFYASHAVFTDKGPMFNFEFEDAVISYGELSEDIIASDRRGNKKNYGSPDADHQFLKLFNAIESVHNPKPVICGPEAARSHTLCINAIQKSVPDIESFPQSIIKRDEIKKRWWIKGLDVVLYNCYKDAILLNESVF